MRKIGSLKSFSSFLFLLVIIASCNKSKTETKKVDSAFSQYITGFTSGVISKKSNIIIELSEASKKFTTPGAKIDADLFDFSPSVKGESFWKDSRTIQFVPTELKSGVSYKIEFELGELVDVEEQFEVFTFSVNTITQSFDVIVEGMSPYEEDDLIWNSFSGTLRTADYLNAENTEELLQIAQNGNQLNIYWEHDAIGKNHSFRVDSVERKIEADELFLEWSGNSNNINVEGELNYIIPSINDFKLMETKVVQLPEQYVSLRFSDPVDSKQNLFGLIRIGDYSDFRFEFDANVLRAFPSKRLSGNKILEIDNEVVNVLGFELDEKQKIEIVFEETNPSVRINDDGVILPSSNGLVFPFEAVNLKAVDVKIVKIYENNIHQFLQENSPASTSSIARVGKTVFKKKVNLVSENAVDYGVWNSFSLDLEELITADPGAIYNVKISFKKAYSLLPCTESSTSTSEENTWLEEDMNDWGYYDEYEYHYYNWSERNDPCSDSYYNYNRGVNKNILSTNLAIIAKAGKDKQILINVSDIRTAKGVSGAKVNVYDFQNQLISEASTGKDGMVWMDLKRKAFLIVAINDNEKTYLKVDDGSALSVSHFDVRGSEVQKGLKGYIFGERGVWRPGDTLFLNFILEDEAQLIPNDHPIKMEIYDPRGQLVDRLIRTKNETDFYSFTYKTDDDALTGSWTVKTSVGGASFSKFIRIETVKPNRLKIKLDFDDEILSSKESSLVNLNAKWLHGAIARNLDVKVALTLSNGNTSFSGYEDYTFKDPTKRFSPSEQLIYEGELNERGNTSFPIDIDVKETAPGMLRANFVTRVFEEGGNFSIDRYTKTYSPYSRYLGIKLYNEKDIYVTDTVHYANIVVLNEKGEISDADEVLVKIYRVGWRWWWDVSDDYLGNYTGRNSKYLVSEKMVKLKNGTADASFQINYPDWGRYLMHVSDPKGGHSVGKTFYVDWPYWQSRDNKDNPGGATMLSFSTDKEEYEVGETATISIPTGVRGRALLSIETGSKILDAEWIEVNGNDLTHQIKISPEMAPNAFISVTLVQTHEHENSLPIRMYGVMPVKVNDPQTHLHPIISMPDELSPESEIEIEVSEKEGSEMTYVLAMVDDGLLDLTRFKTPSPHNSFYALEALGVKTWDIYDYVIGAYGGKLESILSIGGDEGINGKAKDKVNRFKPMVVFKGPFTLNSNESKKHKISIPNYVGSVRTMIIAREGSAYGNAEKTTMVKKPLMVLATLPRVLGPGEKVDLPVTVFAMEKEIEDVEVKITANKAFEKTLIDTKTISFSEPGDQVVNFKLDVAENIGKGSVLVEVRANGESAKYEIEIEVRNPNPPMVRYADGLVNANSSFTKDFDLFGMKGTNEVSFELSSIAPIDFERRLKYLLGYPHGCVEQTTSKAFPQLFIKDVMDTDQDVFDRASDNVKYALDRLRIFQFSDGGFAYWPGLSESSDWGTSYAGHFMLEAEKKGFVLPIGMKDKWVAYQSRTARNYNPNRILDERSYYSKRSYDKAQSYRLFTLALAGKAEIGAMNRLRANNDLSEVGIWRLAASYYMAGQQSIAEEMVVGIPTQVAQYDGRGYSYGSLGRDNAMILEAMIIMDKREEAVSLMKAISSSLVANRWMSTQTTAYCLMAMSKYAGGTGMSNEMDFSYSIDGEQKDALKTLMPIKRIAVDKKLLADRKVSIEVVNNGDAMLFVQTMMEGIPLSGEEESKSSNIEMEVFYSDMEGAEIAIDEIVQGTDFIVEVIVSNPSSSTYLNNLALTQIFPSGWEILNDRLNDGPNAQEEDKPDYQDIRDDRVFTYFNLSRYSSYNDYHTKTFRIVLNAAYVGDFYLPAIKVEAMYDNNFSAIKKGQWVKVVKAE